MYPFQSVYFLLWNGQLYLWRGKFTTLRTGSKRSGPLPPLHILVLILWQHSIKTHLLQCASTSVKGNCYPPLLQPLNRGQQERRGLSFCHIVFTAASKCSFVVVRPWMYPVTTLSESTCILQWCLYIGSFQPLPLYHEKRANETCLLWNN